MSDRKEQEVYCAVGKPGANPELTVIYAFRTSLLTGWRFALGPLKGESDASGHDLIGRYGLAELLKIFKANDFAPPRFMRVEELSRQLTAWEASNSVTVNPERRTRYNGL